MSGELFVVFVMYMPTGKHTIAHPNSQSSQTVTMLICITNRLASLKLSMKIVLEKAPMLCPPNGSQLNPRYGHSGVDVGDILWGLTRCVVLVKLLPS